VLGVLKIRSWVIWIYEKLWIIYRFVFCVIFINLFDPIDLENKGLKQKEWGILVTEGGKVWKILKM
jgi:hypothetical protein